MIQGQDKLSEAEPYLAGRIVHGKSVSMLETAELLLLPFIQLVQYFGWGGGGLRALPTKA